MKDSNHVTKYKTGKFHVDKDSLKVPMKMHVINARKYVETFMMQKFIRVLPLSSFSRSKYKHVKILEQIFGLATQNETEQIEDEAKQMATNTGTCEFYEINENKNLLELAPPELGRL